MRVKMFYDDTLLYEYDCPDVSGLLTAVKEVENIHFDFDVYKYDSSVLNHYKSEDGTLTQELIIYLSVPKKKQVIDKPVYI